MSDGIEFIISASDKTGNAFSSVSGKMGGSAAAAAKMGAAVVGAGAAIFGFTKVMADAIESTADFADKLKLPVEEFSKYQAVATAANIETSTFNMSMQQLYLSTDKAAKGLGEDAKAFAQLGINAKDFRNLNMDGQMNLLADRISNVSNAQERMTIATTLFGARGSDMLKIVGQNSEALQKAAKDAEFLGLAIGPQMAANAKAFGDGMDRSTGAIKGVSMAVANEFMPIFTGMMNKFADTLASNREAITLWVRGAIQGFFTAIEVIKQVFEGIYKLFTDREAQITFLKNLAELPAQVGAIAIAIGKALFIGVWEGFKLLITAIADGAGMIGKIIANVLTGKDAFDGITALSDHLFEQFDSAKERIAGVMSETVGVVGGAMSDIGSGMAESFGINLQAAQESAQAAITSISEFGAVAAESVVTTATVTNEQLAAIGEAGSNFFLGMLEWQTTFVESFFGTMSSAIDSLSMGMAQAIMQGTSLVDVFKNVAKQMLTEILASLIKMGIQRLILSQVIGTATASEASAQAAAAVGLATANGIASWALAPWPINIGAPAFGATMGAAAASGFTAGAATGSALGMAVGAREMGGPVNAGQTYLVGERGPELFTPASTGGITNNNDLMEGSNGGGSIVIEKIEIVMFPNATNADAVFDMDAKKLSRLLSDPIIMALDDMDRKGIKPRFAQRAV